MSDLAFEIDSQVVDSIEAGLIVLDAAGTILRFNAWMAAASGHPSARAVGKSLAEVFPALDNDRLRTAIGSAFKSGTSTLLTHVINGTIFPLATRGRDVLVHDVMISGMESSHDSRCLIHITDVTAFARKERFLRERQNARYNAVVESALDVILTMDGSAKILFANPAALTQFGYAAEELVGKNAAELFHDPEAWWTIWRDIMAVDVLRHSQELVAVCKDGSRSHLEVLGSRWQTDSRVFVTAILRDVNEKREIYDALATLNATLEDKVADRTASLMRAEEALRQGQKMEAVGQLTSGIAHDFNNLLQGIGGSLQIARKRVEKGRIADVDKFISDALECTERAGTLTQRLLAFSRKQPVDPRPTDANKLILSIEELLRRSIGKHVTMNVCLEPNLWLARCDVNQLENALLNAVINARDAMPDGGRITVDTANRVLDSIQSFERGLSPGEYVCVAVIDTGSGMSAETKDKAFDPFFTTKGVGKGTGLGLSMIYGFARQSGGTVRLESEKGVGTKVEIYLPHFAGVIEAEPVEQTVERPISAGGDDVVLVVDDEGVIRLLVVEVLSELGYRALEADDGVSALRIVNSPQRVDLLITDIGLPGINGRELARAARTARPALPVLFMSGYADHGSAAAADGPEEMIQKPFSMDAIASRIRDLLINRRD